MKNPRDQQRPDDDDGGFPDDFARFNSVAIAFGRAVGLLKEINMPCICHLTKPETCWTCRRNEFLAAQQQPSPTAGPYPCRCGNKRQHDVPGRGCFGTAHPDSSAGLCGFCMNHCPTAGPGATCPKCTQPRATIADYNAPPRLGLCYDRTFVGCITAPPPSTGEPAGPQIEALARRAAEKVVNQSHYWDKSSIADRLMVSKSDLATDIRFEVDRAIREALAPTGELVRREDVVEQVARWLDLSRWKELMLDPVKLARDLRDGTWLRDLAALTDRTRCKPWCGGAEHPGDGSTSYCTPDNGTPHWCSASCRDRRLPPLDSPAPDAGQTTKGTP